MSTVLIFIKKINVSKVVLFKNDNRWKISKIIMYVVLVNKLRFTLRRSFRCKYKLQHKKIRDDN